jgi:hypothetical protein
MLTAAFLPSRNCTVEGVVALLEAYCDLDYKDGGWPSCTEPVVILSEDPSWVVDKQPSAL